MRNCRELYQVVLTEYDFYYTDTAGGCIAAIAENLFVRVHRPIVASVQFVTVIKKDGLSIVSAPDQKFAVSKTYYAGLMEKIKIIEAGVVESEGGRKDE